jgi:hypothetical protein
LKYFSNRGKSKDLFKNGAGKQVTAELLQRIGQSWVVKISTTSDPHSDYPKPSKDPQVSCVMDPVVETLDGNVLEVKRNIEEDDKNFQLLAELRALQGRQRCRPIMGMLVDPRNILFTFPRPESKTRLSATRFTPSPSLILPASLVR